MDERLNLRLKEFERALEDFSKALSIQPELFPDLVADTLKSGWIQKFEFTTELMWKTLKDYCFVKLGLDVMSPKRAVKSFFESGACDYALYETLLGLLDLRNSLSHMYRKKLFESAVARMTEARDAYHSLLGALSEKQD